MQVGIRPGLEQAFEDGRMIDCQRERVDFSAKYHRSGKWTRQVGVRTVAEQQIADVLVAGLHRFTKRCGVAVDAEIRRKPGLEHGLHLVCPPGSAGFEQEGVINRSCRLQPRRNAFGPWHPGIGVFALTEIVVPVAPMASAGESRACSKHPGVFHGDAQCRLGNRFLRSRPHLDARLMLQNRLHPVLVVVDHRHAQQGIVRCQCGTWLDLLRPQRMEMNPPCLVAGFVEQIRIIGKAQVIPGPEGHPLGHRLVR